MPLSTHAPIADGDRSARSHRDPIRPVIREANPEQLIDRLYDTWANALARSYLTIYPPGSTTRPT